MPKQKKMWDNILTVIMSVLCLLWIYHYRATYLPTYRTVRTVVRPTYRTVTYVRYVRYVRTYVPYVRTTT